MISAINIDIGHSVTYPFEDPEWKAKVGVLLLLGLIPGMNFIIWGGFALSVAHNIMRDDVPLPNWDDWSDIAVRGFLSILATLVYFLPALVLLAAFALAGPLVSAIGGRTVSSVFNTIRLLGSLLAFLYILIANLLLNVGHLRYAQTDQAYVYRDIGRRLYDLRSDLGLFVSLFLYELVVGLVAGGVSLILSFSCVGFIVVMTLGFLANGYILGVAGIGLLDREQQAGRSL